MSYQILEGDVIEKIRELPDASVDAIVTDPPYGLNFMGKEWDRLGDHSANFTNLDKPHSSQTAYPMNKSRGRPISETDGPAQQRWHFAWAQEALRVLKPGGYLLAFGGSRTYHRMACAVEDAGFEIRDQIMWIYGSGFPKSLDVSKAIDKAAGVEREVIGPPPYYRGKAQQQYSDTRKVSYDYPPQPITIPATDAAKQWQGFGTALKPAHEPIVVARKPLMGTMAANVMQYGTGALNIDACRVEYENTPNPATNPLFRIEHGYRTQVGSDVAGSSFSIKPDGGEVTANALGRWPANVIHDGSEEVLENFPEAPGQCADVKYDDEERKTQNVYGAMRRGHEPSAQQTYRKKGSTNFAMKPGERRFDTGSAARFFYCAKVGRKERNKGCESLSKKPLLWSSGTQSPGTFQGIGTDRNAKNSHPTVKPIALMCYLCRLVTPPKGIVLDLFMGSGSTGIAALREGFDFIGIELNSEYVAIARQRIEGDAPLFNAASKEKCDDDTD
jgi:DNA modification methylase